jgi:hypothetical protein
MTTCLLPGAAMPNCSSFRPQAIDDPRAPSVVLPRKRAMGLCGRKSAALRTER